MPGARGKRRYGRANARGSEKEAKRSGIAKQAVKPKARVRGLRVQTVGSRWCTVGGRVWLVPGSGWTGELMAVESMLFATVGGDKMRQAFGNVTQR
jgi:hypothetical protein